jgi:universal stress protein A
MYKNILLASDFSPEAERAERRAVEMAQKYGAQLSLVHVVDYYPSMQLEGGLAMLPNIEERLNEKAKEDLDICVARLEITLQNTHIGHGPPKGVIIDYANEIEADLIVLGSHGRHGFGLLLGSTATGVLHIAKCDVLAVRVQE